MRLCRFHKLQDGNRPQRVASFAPLMKFSVQCQYRGACTDASSRASRCTEWRGTLDESTSTAVRVVPVFAVCNKPLGIKSRVHVERTLGHNTRRVWYHNLEVVTRVTSLPCQGFCSHDLVFVSLTPDPDLSFAVFFDCSSRSIVAHKNEPKSTLQVLSTLVVSCFVT